MTAYVGAFVWDFWTSRDVGRVTPVGHGVWKPHGRHLENTLFGLKDRSLPCADVTQAVVSSSSRDALTLTLKDSLNYRGSSEEKVKKALNSMTSLPAENIG